MADKTVIIKLDVQEAGAEAQIVSLNNKLSKLTEGEKDYELVLKKIAIQEDRLVKIQAKRAVASTGITKKLTKQKDATGSTTAATMELSRVISDAPYGIRGMANNITQLVSQLGTASKASGGLGGALKGMVTQMMGPLGVVFAITAVVSLIDYLYGANTKATDSVGDLKEEFQSFADVLDKNTNVSIESYLKLMKEKKTLDEASTKAAKRLKEIEEERAGIEYALARSSDFDQLTRLREREIALEKEVTDIYRIGGEAIKEYNDKKKLLTSADANTVNSFKETISALTKERSAVSETSDAWDFYTKKIEIFQNKIYEITGRENKKGRGGRNSKGIINLLDPKDFEGDLFEIEKMLRKFKHKELTLAAETEQQKGAVKALIELDNFKKKYSSYVESEDQKFDKFKENLEKETSAHKANLDKQLKAKKITQEEFNKAASDGQEARDTALAFAEEEFRDKSLVSYENYLKGLVAISDKYDRDIIGVGVTQFDTLAEQQRKAADRVLTGKLNVFQNQAESAKKILSSMTDFVNGEFDREMTIEQNKTNALNTELNNRLNNENLSKEQRKSIQNQIAQNDEKLRVKQEVIERKRFKMNKAANIANALMDTASAAAGVMAQAKGGFFARLAQAIPTIAFGLAQVATIARQKFQSSASKTPINTTGGGGSGGSEGRAEPSFNIVGRSDDNLLINAIQATFDKPLKAYVVSRDVTNQQQLDGIITDQAGT